MKKNQKKVFYINQNYLNHIKSPNKKVTYKNLI